MDEKEIAVNVTGGVVTLIGQVKTYADKLAALHAVERVTGVAGIANELMVVPTAPFEHSDGAIAEAALRALAWSSSVPKNRIQVRVANGWVTLEGKVEWQYQGITPRTRCACYGAFAG